MEVLELTKELKTQVGGLMGEMRKNHDELRKDIKNGHEARESDRKKIADIEGKIQKIYDKFNDDQQKGLVPHVPETKSFEQLFAQSESYKSFMAGDTNEFNIPVDRQELKQMLRKADVLGTQESGVMFSTGMAPTQIDLNIDPGMREKPTIRNLVPSVSVSYTAFEYMRESGEIGDFDVVPEGELKPEIGLEFEKVQSGMRKIAGRMTVTEETLKDVPTMRSYLNNSMRYRLKINEDKKFIKGKGGTRDIEGFMSVAPKYDADLYNAENKLDIISWAMAQAEEESEYVADGIVMSLRDWNEIWLSKDAVGRYQFARIEGMAVPLLWGRPVITSNAMRNKETGVNQFLVGNFWLTSQIRDLELMNLRAGYINDQFARNELTLLLEERTSLEIRVPDAFVKGTFDPKTAAA